MSQIFNHQNVNMIHIELSTFCNAACPSCPRYFPGSMVVRSGLDVTSVSLDQFMKWFDLNTINQIKHWRFCGTHGDPMMAKDVIRIIEYIFKNNPSAEITINTNGGMRSVEDWRYLGNISSKNKLNIIFSIDGLKDTNHLYRRNVNWSTLMNNVTAYINAKGTAIWEFLLFAHNQHQIQEAQTYSRQLGFKQFVKKNAVGFERGNEIEDIAVFGKTGDYEYSILPPNCDEQKVRWRSRKNSKNFWESNTEYIINTYNKAVKNFIDDIVLEKTEIRCLSESIARGHFSKGAEIYINVNGVVYPCCFIGTSMDAFDTSTEALQLQSRMNELGKDNFNLNNASLQTILNNNFLTKFTEDTWKTNKCLSFCNKTCGQTKTLLEKIYSEK